MINVKLLNNNNIITIQGEGKLPIKSAEGYMFYNPNELLCIAIGACIGKQLLYYCNKNKIDVNIIESVDIDMEDEDEILIYLKFPKDYNDNIITDIKTLLHHCPISKKLITKINIISTKSDNNYKDVINKNNIKPCCGK